MDEQLQRLIDEVCRYEEATPQRQKALNKLLIIVQQLPGIYKSYHQDYLEALNKTWDWVCKNIDKFEARDNCVEQSLVRWINGYLKWRVKDLYLPNSNYPSISLDERMSNEEGQQTTLLSRISDTKFIPDPENSHNTLDLLDLKIAEIQQRDRDNLAQKIIECIEYDEKRQLRSCCTRKNAECNCQLLAKRLLLTKPSHKIADIAREFNVSNQTLYSHWKKKCLPLLKEIGVNLRID